MINGQIDLGVIIFKLAQALLVLFVGFLSFYGLFALIEDSKSKKPNALDIKIQVYEKKKQLYQAKQAYYELKNELNPGLFRSIANEFKDRDYDYVQLNTLDETVEEEEEPDIIIEEPKEVEILSLNEELAKDPDFLSHNEYPEDTKIISSQELKITPLEDNNLQQPQKDEKSENQEKKNSGFFSSLLNLLT